MAIAVLLPALLHGSSLGSFDLLSRRGLTSRPGVVVHNPWTSDQIGALIPWTTLAWSQVHQGHLPLWNPYSALGMPLAFNWQSAVFSVPTLISYLAPERLAYTVQVIATLILAGLGVYVFCRMLRLGALAAAFAAGVFELSGPMIGWLGWPHAAVMSWVGWLFAASLLIVRGQRRALAVSMFAVVLACAIYAGQLEILTFLALTLGGFLLALFVTESVKKKDFRWTGRPIFDFALATAAGVALGAPLLLPGEQVLHASLRNVTTGTVSNSPYPVAYLMDVIAPGFHGEVRPLYLGVIALSLAGVAIVTCYRRTEVLAFGAIAIVLLAIIVVPFVVSLLTDLPAIGGILWYRALLPLAFVIAILAGVGFETLIRSFRSPLVLRSAGVGFAFLGVVTLLVWALADRQAVIDRATSFWWPAALALIGLLVVSALFVVSRRPSASTGRYRSALLHAGGISGLILLLAESAFLIASGAPMWSSSATFFGPTQAVEELQSAVGSSLVGCESVLGCEALGITPDTNVAYRVDELGVYDPMVPEAYFGSWESAERSSAGYAGDFIFSPSVTTANEARLYGVGFVLAPKGSAGPSGAVFDKQIGDENLFRIPGAAAATLTVGGSAGEGNGIPVTHPSPSTWELHTDASTAGNLKLRLTAEPGWRATIDGRPLALNRFAKVMLQARVPAGRHKIVLTYWPNSFTVGLILAGCALVGLLAFGAADVYKRRTAHDERQDP